jgi:hypothetical protein
MDPANYREALREAAADEAEGADIMMVKPGALTSLRGCCCQGVPRAEGLVPCCCCQGVPRAEGLALLSPTCSHVFNSSLSAPRPTF